MAIWNNPSYVLLRMDTGPLHPLHSLLMIMFQVLFSADLRHLKKEVDHKRSSSQSSPDEKPSRAKQKKTRVESP